MCEEELKKITDSNEGELNLLSDVEKSRVALLRERISKMIHFLNFECNFNEDLMICFSSLTGEALTDERKDTGEGREVRRENTRGKTR